MKRQKPVTRLVIDQNYEDDFVIPYKKTFIGLTILNMVLMFLEGYHEARKKGEA